GNAQKEAGHSILSLQPRSAWQYSLLIEHDRFAHLHRSRGRRVVSRASLEVLHDLSAAVAGPIDDRVQLRLRNQLGGRDPTHRRVGDKGHHRVAVTAEHHYLAVAHRNAWRVGE